MGPGRSILTCKQKAHFVGRWRFVGLEQSCSNFYPSSTFKAGSEAARRIPLTQGKFAIVDSADYYRLVKFQWFATGSYNTFYAARAHRGKTVKMHREITGAPGHLVVDHIDRNGLNNRKSNLRVCTNAQNVRNAGPRGNGLSRYKGVSRHTRGKKWTAVIQLNNKTHYLGYFDNEIDAAKAYDKRASQLHGEFACLNFPAGEIATDFTDSHR